MDVRQYIEQLGGRARDAARVLAQATTSAKNKALLAMAEVIEMLRKAGGVAWDAIKSAGELLWEMSSFNDAWEIIKAVHAWINGKFDGVDKLELAFAGIGLTVTVVSVVTSVVSGGTSLAALVSVKGALSTLKGMLKKMVRDDRELLEVMGTAVRWAFGLVSKAVSGKAGREAVIKELMDFKDAFIELITNGTRQIWYAFTKVGVFWRLSVGG